MYAVKQTMYTVLKTWSLYLFLRSSRFPSPLEKPPVLAIYRHSWASALFLCHISYLCSNRHLQSSTPAIYWQSPKTPFWQPSPPPTQKKEKEKKLCIFFSFINLTSVCSKGREPCIKRQECYICLCCQEVQADLFDPAVGSAITWNCFNRATITVCEKNVVFWTTALPYKTH